MNDDSGMPLRAAYVDGVLDMRVGAKTFRFAAENHPDLWDECLPRGAPNVTITDLDAFARAVIGEINREDEDGSTLLTRMLDKAILAAVENGCEGVDHEADMALREGGDG